MPIAKFQMPDGRVAKFEVPEGTSPEDATAFAEQYFSTSEKIATQDYDIAKARKLALKQGLSFNLADEISGIGAGIEAALPGGKSPMEAYRGKRDELRELQKQYGEDRPWEQLGLEIAGSVPTLAIPGLGIFKMAQNATKYGQILSNLSKTTAAGAAIGGAYSFGAAEGEPTEQLAETAKGAALGGALSLAAPITAAGMKGAQGIKRAFSEPLLDEGLVETAQLAKKYNIPFSMDEISKSKAIKNVQKISQEIPLSGQAAFRDIQLSAWNKQLLKNVGIDGEKFTPTIMDKAFINIGKEFDAIGRGKTYQLNDVFKQRADEIAEEASQIASQDAIKNFKNRVGIILKNANKDGTITGEKLGQLRSETNKLARKAANYDTKEILRDLENLIIDTMTGGDDVAAAAFSKTKEKYKNLLILEPLAAKAKGGVFSPSLLLPRVSRIYGRQFVRGQAGEMGDLARIGYELLPEVGGSDTLQKAAYTLAAITNPLIAAPIIGVNRLYQEKFNRSQALIEKALKKQNKISDAIKGREP